MYRVIGIASDEGSLVLDPFGGAGTTYVAAELLGRKWIGTELHCETIIQRFDDLDGDRGYLKELQLNKNVLFTQADLARRGKSGLPLSASYRISANTHKCEVREEPDLRAGKSKSPSTEQRAFFGRK